MMLPRTEKLIASLEERVYDTIGAAIGVGALAVYFSTNAAVEHGRHLYFHLKGIEHEWKHGLGDFPVSAVKLCEQVELDPPPSSDQYRK